MRGIAQVENSCRIAESLDGNSPDGEVIGKLWNMFYVINPNSNLLIGASIPNKAQLVEPEAFFDGLVRHYASSGFGRVVPAEGQSDDTPLDEMSLPEFLLESSRANYLVREFGPLLFRQEIEGHSGNIMQLEGFRRSKYQDTWRIRNIYG